MLPTLLLSIACTRQTRVESLTERAEGLDWSYTPVLPSPDAGTYMASPGGSRDAIIRALTSDKAFDRALESGAAGLALSAVEGNSGLSRWELREAMWRGGWPYPVLDARGWSALTNQPPPDDLFGWLEAVPVTEPMALVRARGTQGDGWIGLRAHPDVDLGMLPRRTPLGAPLDLPPIAGATFRLADGGGALTEGPLDAGERLLLASAGEWLLQILRDGRELARFPIYVGIEAASEPLLRLDGEPPLIGTADDAESWAARLLLHVREAYRVPAWKRDALMDSAARALAEDGRRDLVTLLTPLGVDPSSAAVWTCDDTTVENCLDRWVWDPRLRRVLLDPLSDLLGIHGVVDARGVHLTAVIADLP
jgi:hypothetical protein